MAVEIRRWDWGTVDETTLVPMSSPEEFAALPPDTAIYEIDADGNKGMMRADGHDAVTWSSFMHAFPGSRWFIIPAEPQVEKSPSPGF